MIPVGIDLRKDFIIFNIVIMTNVFSCDGVDNWNFFIFRSLCGSGLVDHKTVLLVGGSWTGNRNRLNHKGLSGCSMLFL